MSVSEFPDIVHPGIRAILTAGLYKPYLKHRNRKAPDGGGGGGGGTDGGGEAGAVPGIGGGSAVGGTAGVAPGGGGGRRMRSVGNGNVGFVVVITSQYASCHLGYDKPYHKHASTCHQS